MKLTGTALFLWLGTAIAVVNAVDVSAPPHSNLHRRDVMDYDNSLYERDLAELDERAVDDLFTRTLFGDFEKRDDLVARAINSTVLEKRTSSILHRAVVNYDNGLYDRDLADLNGRAVDDFVTRAFFDELEKRDFDGTDINKRQAQAIVKGVETAAKVIWKVVDAIKGQIDKEKDARSKYTSALAGRLCSAKPAYNWVVIHTKHDMRWDGVRGKDWGHMHKEFPLGWLKRTTGFEIYYGKSGKLIRQGDGGWLNWGFCGRFDRKNDKEVTFFKP